MNNWQDKAETQSKGKGKNLNNMLLSCRKNTTKHWNFTRQSTTRRLSWNYNYSATNRKFKNSTVTCKMCPVTSLNNLSWVARTLWN